MLSSPTPSPLRRRPRPPRHLGSPPRERRAIELPPQPQPQPPRAARRRAKKIEVGSVIGGDFRVVARIGKGGMGVVYCVDQLSTGRRRALKVMRESLGGDAELRARFEREARLSAQIASEHVVEVVATGVDPGSGRLWLAMELLDGVDLRQHLSRARRLSLEHFVDVFRQLCHGVAAAHVVGIVHRDLKPENVFLAKLQRADVPHTVKVLDFGLAKALSLGRQTQTLTRAVGTPLYMAPEQFRAGRVTPAADVWALGLIAFELLTGHHYGRRRVPASERARKYGVTLPPGFDEWFARCLAPSPAARWTNAGVAFQELERCLARGKRAQPSRPVTLLPEPPPWLVVIVAMLVLCWLVVGGVLASLLALFLL